VQRLTRTGRLRVEKYFIINIDHHRQCVLWRDQLVLTTQRCACGDGVRTHRRLNVPLTPEIARHIYIAILNGQPGAFHYGKITPERSRSAGAAGCGRQSRGIAARDLRLNTLGRLRPVLAACSNGLDAAAGGTPGARAH